MRRGGSAWPPWKRSVEGDGGSGGSEYMHRSLLTNDREQTPMNARGSDVGSPRGEQRGGRAWPLWKQSVEGNCSGGGREYVLMEHHLSTMEANCVLDESYFFLL